MARTRIFMKKKDGTGQIYTSSAHLMRLKGTPGHPPGGYVNDVRRANLVTTPFGEQRWICFLEGTPEAVDFGMNVGLTAEQVYHLSGSMIPDIIKKGLSSRGKQNTIPWKIIGMVVAGVAAAGFLAFIFL